MKVTFSGFKDIKAMASRIQNAQHASERAAYRSVNAVLSKVTTAARRDIASKINLPQGYITDQMHSTKATAADPKAMLRIRRRGIGLARFAAIQLTKPAPRAKGDPLRKIARGRKQAGVSVKVLSKGSRKTLRGAFLLPMRAGKINGGNGFGLFIRDGRAGPRLDYEGQKGMDMQKYKWRGNIRHLYGPSPDQLFRRWRADSIPNIKRMLAETYASQLRYELRGTRK